MDRAFGDGAQQQDYFAMTHSPNPNNLRRKYHATIAVRSGPGSLPRESISLGFATLDVIWQRLLTILKHEPYDIESIALTLAPN